MGHKIKCKLPLCQESTEHAKSIYFAICITAKKGAEKSDIQLSGTGSSSTSGLRSRRPIQILHKVQCTFAEQHSIAYKNIIESKNILAFQETYFLIILIPRLLFEKLERLADCKQGRGFHAFCWRRSHGGGRPINF